ncbi:glycosyltransferase family 4 protein [Luteolibacter sp. Populi]|uniref:glycosyltransferase family 4 protein n=1 Tax=Luteolibacter sp. Populi TaxID=3230487 RepID=UPI0034674CDD
MKILLSAYYCSPYRGGESAVGWNVATGLAKHHEITVICGDLSSDSPTGHEIQRFKEEQGLPPGLEIHHVQAEGLTLKIHDAHSLPGLWFLYYAAYRRWQLQALDLARQLHAGKPFDLVHHVNVIGFREPGYLWQMGIPFFWGPVTGAPMVPPAFLADFGPKERFRWGSRNFLNRLQIRLGGRPAQAARAATKVWGVSQEDRDALASWGVTAEPMLETGAAPPLARPPRSRAAGEPLRICWSGLFQGIKALPVLLRAIAASPAKEEMLLEVLGDGPEAARWRSLATSLGLDSRIHWHGMLPRDQALEVMNTSHVLVHSSVKEGAPHVVLEALSMGMPVICHDACGMGTAVTPACGIKVPLVDPATSTAGFGAALDRLISTPGLLGELSAGASQRASELTWESNILRFDAAYRQAVGNR